MDYYSLLGANHHPKDNQIGEQEAVEGDPYQRLCGILAAYFGT
jgi:hypothetical protein